MTNQNEFSESFFLTPGECNPEKEMPISVLVSRIIEVATLHANTWGVGFATLAKENQSWVLSRVTIEMKRFPTLNENYKLTTWIENFNKFFSERDFEITDGENNIIGYARTIWVVIDSTTRESVDISRFTFMQDYISEKECPIAKQRKLRPLDEYESKQYTFRYCDVDFNRHINSCKYIELLLNQWSLDFHDHHKISRFEIAYMKEAYFDETVEIRIKDMGNDKYTELVHNDEHLCRAHFTFEDV